MVIRPMEEKDALSEHRGSATLPQQLMAALQNARHGHGRIVELVGESGIGKTRMLVELMDQARSAGVRVVSSRCTESSPNITTDIAAYLAIDPEGCVAREVLDAAAEDLLVVIDDFHWADAKSVELIELLSRSQIERRLLVVVAVRPRQADSRLRAALSYGREIGTIERVDIGPLSLAESARLLGRPARDPDVVALHQRASGNPRYLLALASPQGESATALLEEKAALGPDETLAMEAAAVLADGMDVAAIAAVAELPHERACAATGALLRRDLLRPVERTRTFAFRHPVLRNAFYTETDMCWRAAAHRRAAAALAARGAPAAQIARHVERAPNGPDSNDVEVLAGAAEDAIATDPARAVHWLQVALTLTPQSVDTRARLLLAMGRALGASGELARSRDVLHKVIQQVPFDRWSVRAEAMASGALAECFLGRGKEAARRAAAALEAIPEHPPHALVRLVVTHGVLAALEGVPIVHNVLDLAVDLAREHGDSMGEVGALAVRGFARAKESDLDAAASVVDSLPDPDLAMDPECLVMLASAEAFLGRYRNSRRHTTRGIDVMRKNGRRHVLPILLNGLSNTCRRLGDLEAAHIMAAESAQIAESLQAVRIRGLALALQSLSLAWLLPVDSREAIELAEEAVAAVPPGTSAWSATAALALAQATVLGGQPRRALSVILDIGQGPNLPGVPEVLRPWCYELLTAAAAAVAPGHEVDEWASRAVAAADHLGMPYLRSYAVAAQAHRSRSRSDLAEATAHYLEAATLFHASDLICSQATALVAAARCESALGREEQAASHLALARELARRSGAGRILDELDGAPTRGVSMPHPVLSGLTQREQQIASIAGTGKKTRDIAEILEISPRTVDVHLTRIYRKLNITTRAELARLMGEIA